MEIDIPENQASIGYMVADRAKEIDDEELSLEMYTIGRKLIERGRDTDCGFEDSLRDFGDG